jgi:hypothetical protein
LYTTDLKVLPKNPSYGHVLEGETDGERLGKELCLLVGSTLGVNDGMLLGIDDGWRVGNLVRVLILFGTLVGGLLGL